MTTKRTTTPQYDQEVDLLNWQLFSALESPTATHTAIAGGFQHTYRGLNCSIAQIRPRPMLNGKLCRKPTAS